MARMSKEEMFLQYLWGAKYLYGSDFQTRK
jgi:hypothetical protein